MFHGIRMTLFLAVASSLTVMQFCCPAVAAEKWQAAMDQFAKQDQASPPPKDVLLFIGSSSIRMWNLDESFGELPTLNRGFGGSEYADVVKHADQLIKPYRPRAVVLYSGDNDLWRGKSPNQVRQDFMKVVAAIRAHTSEVPIIAIGVKPSLARIKLTDNITAANKALAAIAAKDAKMKFIDPFDFMLNAEGKPSKDLLLKDGLHMNKAGYALWTPRVQDALEQLEK